MDRKLTADEIQGAVTGTIAPVPEPAMMGLLAACSGALLMRRRRRR